MVLLYGVRMGLATCQHCGGRADVQRPTEPFVCPSCGKVTGGRMTRLEQATKDGWMLVLFALAALFGLIAVSGFLFG
jgi:predicted RNA-binding Zn-ribbon protein involved in translation (DUF1610 family)